MYSPYTELSKKICREIGWSFEIGGLETLQRKGKIFVRGTALKLEEAIQLENRCIENGFIYRGP